MVGYKKYIIIIFNKEKINKENAGQEVTGGGCFCDKKIKKREKKGFGCLDMQPFSTSCYHFTRTLMNRAAAAAGRR